MVLGMLSPQRVSVVSPTVRRLLGAVRPPMESRMWLFGGEAFLFPLRAEVSHSSPTFCVGGRVSVMIASQGFGGGRGAGRRLVPHPVARPCLGGSVPCTGRPGREWRCRGPGLPPQCRGAGLGAPSLLCLLSPPLQIPFQWPRGSPALTRSCYGQPCPEAEEMLPRTNVILYSARD